ncbi:MAG: hypothetical protein RIQ89_1640 [Bacteroidota bacterium]|jgi:membrane protein
MSKIINRIFQKVKGWLQQFAIFRFLFANAKRLVLPGFEGVPLYEVGQFFITGIKKGSLNTRASALSFKFFLALFPAIIFLFSLIPYVPIPNFQNQLLGLIQDVVPNTAYQAARSTIEDIIKHQRGGLLSIGFIMALYFTTNGFMAMIKSFNSSYHIVETRKPWKQRKVAIILTFIISILLIIATMMIIFGEIFSKFLVKKSILKTKTQVALLLGVKWLIVLTVIFLAISFLYHYAPAVRKKWKFISAGATLATILSIITSLGFAYFVNNFNQYNKVYGSIGTLIVIMLWINFNSQILLLGFELNASIDNVKKTKSEKKTDTIKIETKKIKRTLVP